MTNMTYHARVERQARLEYIVDTVGIGEVIAVAINKDYRGGYRQLTSTGIIIITGDDNKTIVTAYIADTKQAIALYKEDKKTHRIPEGLYNRIKNNQKYIAKQPRG